MKTKPSKRGEEKLTHTADHTMPKILMIGTEKGLRSDTPARARALRYAALTPEMAILVVGRGTSEPDLDIAPNAKVIDVLRGNYLFSLWEAFQRGRAIVRAGEPWLISAQDPFEIGLVAYLISRLKRCPLHLQVHTDPGSVLWQKESLTNRLRWVLFRFLVRRAAGVRAVSMRVKKILKEQGVSDDRIVVLPIAADLSLVRRRKSTFELKDSYPAASHLIVGVGRFSREKGFDLLIRALLKVHRVFPHAILLLVGKGNEESALRRLSRELGLERAVKFVPWARDTFSYYRGADVVVVPSRYEGWGLAPVEAYLSGGAVVMTNVGCAGEVIKDGETGIVVSTEDSAALADGIMKVLSDPELRQTFAKHQKDILKLLATEEAYDQLLQEAWKRAFLSQHEHIEKKQEILGK